MRAFNLLVSRSLTIWLLAAAVLLGPAWAIGDTVYYQAMPKGKPLARPNVTIKKIDKADDDEFESLYWVSNDSNRTEHRNIARILQIEADGEVVFNQAEAEFAKGDLKAADADYRKATSTTTRQWVKHRANLRVVAIAIKSADFPAAVGVFLDIAGKDPAAARSQTPDITSAKPDQLTSAIAGIKQSVAGASAESKLVLYPFLSALQTKTGDAAGARASLAALKELTPEPAKPAQAPESKETPEKNPPATPKPDPKPAAKPDAKTPTLFPATDATRIVFLCDASGSMINRMIPLKDQLKLAITKLGPKQSFTIIFFQDRTLDALDRDGKLVPANMENKHQAGIFVDAITTTGTTDPIPGMEMAFKIKPELIYFLTDGDFPDNDAVLKSFRTLNADKKVKVITIAFTAQSDTDTAYKTLLKTIATESGGTFHDMKEEQFSEEQTPPKP